MIQTGDPTGTGKGGQSIWGEYFPVRSYDLNENDCWLIDFSGWNKRTFESKTECFLFFSNKINQSI